MNEDKASNSAAKVPEVEIKKQRTTSAADNAAKESAATASVKGAPVKKAAAKKRAPVKKSKEAKASSKRAKAASKAKRTFPQAGLEECIKLVNVIKQFNSGNPWAPKEIANALNVGMGNSYFYLTAACRDYGLTIGTRESAKIELTDLGRNLAYPKSSAMRRFSERCV